jgi:soluble lytic murein transglycosylase-like protein
MIPIAIGVVVLGSFYLFSKKAETSDSSSFDANESDYIMRKYGLKDIDPSIQGGKYKRDYDIYFKISADEFDVPFALLKAHAVAESSMNERAIRNEPDGSASYGLMQLLWKNNKSSWMFNRFSSTGISGEKLSKNIEYIYDPLQNIKSAADLVSKNLDACKGNIRDAINMYNTGAKESVRVAPHNYTEKVLKYYNQILGEI